MVGKKHPRPLRTFLIASTVTLLILFVLLWYRPLPALFCFILPMMVSLLPDVEADSHLAWIPFVNISMLMKELLKGNYLWGFYAITLVSTLVLTVLAFRFNRKRGED